MGEIDILNKDMLYMKSVIVQGASVAKAIDEALSKAGMPKEFFVKILEEAQPGFLGFGAKKAKIALFFKKEDKKLEGSLLSRGTYKNLFDNEAIQLQLQNQDCSEVSRDNFAQEAKVKPVQGVKVMHNKDQNAESARDSKIGRRPGEGDRFSSKDEDRSHGKEHGHRVRKGQRELSHSNKHEQSQSVREDKQHIAKQQNPKAVNNASSVQPLQRRLLVQRPLKSLIANQKPQDQKVPQPLKEAERAVQPPKNDSVEAVPQNHDNQKSQSAKKRARRRRHYGYRSKTSVQWSKGKDESSFGQLSDEQHDSGSE